MVEVNVKILGDNAVLPQYSKDGDAAMDLVATSMRVTEATDHGYVEYGTGLAFEIPRGYVGLIYPRSSISNTGMILSNSVGVIDSGYRGEVRFRFKYIAGTKKYDVGDRVGQIMILPYPVVKLTEVEELASTDRGTGGFGSTNI